MIMHKQDQIRKQAIFLAKENVEAEPDIKTVYWFPDDEEVRLVEVEDMIPISGERVDPFYFDASPEDNMPAPSGIALIRSDEVNKLILPDGWGTWDSAEKLEI